MPRQRRVRRAQLSTATAARTPKAQAPDDAVLGAWFLPLGAAGSDRYRTRLLAVILGPADAAQAVWTWRRGLASADAGGTLEPNNVWKAMFMSAEEVRAGAAAGGRGEGTPVVVPLPASRSGTGGDTWTCTIYTVPLDTTGNDWARVASRCGQRTAKPGYPVACNTALTWTPPAPGTILPDTEWGAYVVQGYAAGGIAEPFPGVCCWNANDHCTITGADGKSSGLQYFDKAQNASYATSRLAQALSSGNPDTLPTLGALQSGNSDWAFAIPPGATFVPGSATSSLGPQMGYAGDASNLCGPAVSSTASAVRGGVPMLETAFPTTAYVTQTTWASDAASGSGGGDSGGGGGADLDLGVACRTGHLDARQGGSACVSQRCNPSTCWEATAATIALNPALDCIAPQPEGADADMAVTCITQGAVRPATFSLGYITGSSSPDEPLPLRTPLTDLPMNSSATWAAYTQAPCACAGDVDAAACSAPGGAPPNGADASATEASACVAWCARTMSADYTNVGACVRAAQDFCSTAAGRGTAACACVAANRGNAFPGMGGRTLASMEAVITEAAGTAAPAALGVPQCWWSPCLQAVNAGGGGSYLPAVDTLVCPGTHAVCAVHISQWGTARAAWEGNPTPDSLSKVNTIVNTISQSCAICPPPPDAPPGTKGTQGACPPGPNASSPWHITAYNSLSVPATVALPGATRSASPITTTLAPGVTRIVPGNSDDGMFAPPSPAFTGAVTAPGVPGGAALAFAAVLGASPPTAVLSQSPDGSLSVATAIVGTTAVLVVGPAAPGYAAAVTACPGNGTCPGGVLPSPSDTGRTLLPVAVTAYNYTSAPASVCLGGTCSGTGSVPSVPPTPCDGSGGMACAPTVFPPSSLGVGEALRISEGAAGGGAAVAPLGASPLASAVQAGACVVAQVSPGGPAGPVQVIVACLASPVAAARYAAMVNGAGVVAALPAPTPPGGSSGPAAAWRVVAVNHGSMSATLQVGVATGQPVPLLLSVNAAMQSLGVSAAPTLALQAVQVQTAPVAAPTASLHSTGSALGGAMVVVTAPTNVVMVGVYDGDTASLATAQAFVKMVNARGVLGMPPPPLAPSA